MLCLHFLTVFLLQLMGECAQWGGNRGGGIQILPPYRVTRFNQPELSFVLLEHSFEGGDGRRGGGEHHGGLEAHGGLGGCVALEVYANLVLFFNTTIFIEWNSLVVQKLNVSNLCGIINLEIFVLECVKKNNKRVIDQVSEKFLLYHQVEYEVYWSDVESTRMIDGSFIELIHWSVSEGRRFNPILNNMSSQNWRQQIYFMKQVGIKNVILQATFLNNDYETINDTKCMEYKGYALYPSQIYSNPYPNWFYNDDKIEAILDEADKEGLSIWIGAGNFAWFSYNNESLCWAKRVVTELWNKYGHHPSFYGWYITQEMAGNLDYHTPFFHPGIALEMQHFFISLRLHLNTLPPPHLAPLRSCAPTPVMLAINSQDLLRFSLEWMRIFPFLNVVSVFGFARIPDSPSPRELREMCEGVGAQMWVDMELFVAPITEEGLFPKNISEIITEILAYDDVMQIGSAYEWTGLMDSPESEVHLGGKVAAELFVEYKTYYEKEKENYLKKCQNN